MPQKPYNRGNQDEARIQFRGINTVLPPDRMPPNKYPFAQNIRAYLRDRVEGRATQDSSVETLPFAVHTLRRLNDTTPAGPPTGFILVAGASTRLYAGITEVDSGLSGNPLSLLPFRPNASVQPWMYVGDSLKMDKVRSDGLRYKMGIAEPQGSPVVNFVAASDQISLIGPVTVTYWGDSPHSGPTANYIWKNAHDVPGLPIRSAVPPTGVASGNSLIFDLGNIGNQHNPVAWTQYQTYSGTVTTSAAGNTVGWDSGDDFGGLAAGQSIIINAVSYTIATAPAPTNTVLHLTTSPGDQVGVRYLASAVNGSVPLFSPALESEGYSDFNFVVEATLYVPAAGSYNLHLDSKDGVIWGIGSNPTGKASWSGGLPYGGFGNVFSVMGQHITALNGYPLLPTNVTNDGTGQTVVAGVNVNFSEPGNYPIEINYDYWYHSGRTLRIRANGVDIPPIPGSAITGAQYRYTYRSSATGATSNPSPPSGEETLSVLANRIIATPSNDLQVDKIDFYRLDTGLTNYTYVGTGPNSTAPFTDALLDSDIAANPILEFDNFEPFPSIDLPKKGTVNVANGVATWVSGDKFNIRWLPGTIVIVGTVAYTLDKRPTSTVSLTASNVEIQGGISIVIPLASGTNLTYEIAEPILAAQPLPYIWGPTDNVNFAFGVGDPLRPGTLYWCKGNNLDSAPDTNQEDVTSPSEPLQNGVIVSGLGMVFSTERAWLIYPNFFNALATVQGTIGSTWTLQETISTRGLYIPKALAVDGGGNVFFRAKDGVYVSPGGQGSKSITEDLYNLFPHEGLVPSPIVRGGYTIWPPDDTRPQAQTMTVANGYLYYDYEDVSGTPRTLVFDIEAGGWVVDEYQHLVVCHMLEEGAGVNGVLTGCQDGGVRPLVDSGNENECAILLMPCFTAGDVRAQKHYGDLYVEAAAEFGSSLEASQPFNTLSLDPPHVEEDLLNWVMMDTRRFSEHLATTYTYLDGDSVLTASAGAKFWWLKAPAGFPWDINRYDSNYLYFWITENGDQPPVTASGWKRFVNPVPIAPRLFTLGTTITIDTPAPNNIKRTINCEADSQALFDLGHIRGVTEGPVTIAWGGDLGVQPTIVINYYWGGTGTIYNTRERFFIVKGWGRVKWDTAHWTGSNYQVDQEAVHTVLAAGGSPDPSFPCGFVAPWWS